MICDLGRRSVVSQVRKLGYLVDYPLPFHPIPSPLFLFDYIRLIPTPVAGTSSSTSTPLPVQNPRRQPHIGSGYLETWPPRWCSTPVSATRAFPRICSDLELTTSRSKQHSSRGGIRTPCRGIHQPKSPRRLVTSVLYKTTAKTAPAHRNSPLCQCAALHLACHVKFLVRIRWQWWWWCGGGGAGEENGNVDFVGWGGVERKEGEKKGERGQTGRVKRERGAAELMVVLVLVLVGTNFQQRNRGRGRLG